MYQFTQKLSNKSSNSGSFLKVGDTLTLKECKYNDGNGGVQVQFAPNRRPVHVADANGQVPAVSKTHPIIVSGEVVVGEGETAKTLKGTWKFADTHRVHPAHQDVSTEGQLEFLNASQEKGKIRYGDA